MDYNNLCNNIISVIKESLIKLGYDSMPIGINYMSSSLVHLLGDEISEDDLATVLQDFAAQNESTLGTIDIKPIKNGYHLTISAQGVEYVHSTLRDDEFLPQFINAVRSPATTIDDIIALFHSFGDDVVVQRVDNDEFDYLIYFESGTPDAFYYCIDSEDLGMTYHRFTKQDYIDFDF